MSLSSHRDQTARIVVFAVSLALASGSAAWSDGAATPARSSLPGPHDVRTIAGDGGPGYRDGSALQATFMLPAGVATDASGRIYVADRAAQRIRVIDRGRVTTLAGTGSDGTGGLHITGGYVDGVAQQARFNEPTGVTVTSDGSVYVADELNHCIRRVKDGVVTTYAGSPAAAGSQDGPRGAAQFRYPHDIAHDSHDNLYVADFKNGIRKIDEAGNVTTLKLKPVGRKTFTGVSVWDRGGQFTLFAVDGQFVHVYFGDAKPPDVWGNAVEGSLTFPPLYGVVAVSADEALMTGAQDHVVRLFRAPSKFDTTFSALPIAGTPYWDQISGAGYQDGPPAAARFFTPLGLAVRDGDIIVADGGNRRIRAIPMPSLRRPIGENFAELSSDPAHYRILYVSSSYAFWLSTWSNSIGGQIEDELNAERARIGLNRPVKVSVARLDATNLAAEADYVKNLAADGQVNLVIMALNSGQTSGLPENPPGNWGGTVTRILSDLQGALNASHTKIFVLTHPQFTSASPVENIVGREVDGEAPSFNAARAEATERTFADAVKASGVPSHSATEDFNAYERTDHHRPLFGVDDTHFTPYGNSFVAKLIVREIERIKPWQ